MQYVAVGVVCACTDVQVCKLSYHSRARYKLLWTTFVAQVRPTSAISVAMLGGRDCLLG